MNGKSKPLAFLLLMAGAASGQPREFLTLANGQRFFPVGLYGFPQNRTDDAIYKEARAAGFNFLVGHEAREGFLRSYDIPGGPPDPDAATRRGSLLDLTYNTAAKRQTLIELAKHNENTAGVIVWQGPDEPNYFPFGTRPGPSSTGLQAGADALRSTSKHPLWINFSPTGDDRAPRDFSSLAHYLAVPDVVSVDIYPVGGGADLQESPFADRGLAAVGDFTRNLVRVVSVNGRKQKPVWMVLQGFGWQALGAASNPPEKWNGRTPTYDEIRFMTFDAIINGATGVIYWGAPFIAKEDNATWDSLKRVATELQSLQPALTGEILAADHHAYSANRNIEIAVRQAGRDLYLLMANASPLDIGETEIEFHGKKLRAKFGPFAVEVRKLAE
jgi:hypothetical protein